MTIRDEIIKMAREAGMVVVDDEFSLIPFLERFFHMAQAAEREACAKAFEAEAETWEAWPQAGAAKRKGAAAIRSRGQA